MEQESEGSLSLPLPLHEEPELPYDLQNVRGKRFATGVVQRLRQEQQGTSFTSESWRHDRINGLKQVLWRYLYRKGKVDHVVLRALIGEGMRGALPGKKGLTK